MAGPTDLNNDGFDDLILGAPYAQLSAPNTGLVLVHPGGPGGPSAALAAPRRPRRSHWLCS